jgi:hypothetical protein
MSHQQEIAEILSQQNHFSQKQVEFQVSQDNQGKSIVNQLSS